MISILRGPVFLESDEEIALPAGISFNTERIAEPSAFAASRRAASLAGPVTRPEVIADPTGRVRDLSEARDPRRKARDPTRSVHVTQPEVISEIGGRVRDLSEVVRLPDDNVRGSAVDGHSGE
jgi:hypothetical protein